jgi:hypothetical protein
MTVAASSNRISSVATTPACTVMLSRHPASPMRATTTSQRPAGTASTWNLPSASVMAPRGVPAIRMMTSLTGSPDDALSTRPSILPTSCADTLVAAASMALIAIARLHTPRMGPLPCSCMTFLAPPRPAGNGNLVRTPSCAAAR